MRLGQGGPAPRKRPRPGRLWSLWLFGPLALAGAIEAGIPKTVRAGASEAAPAPDRLAATFERAAELPALSSLIVAQGGEVIGEEYYRGMRPSRQVNIKSASKSILSALVGIALTEGHLESLDQTLPELLPDHFPAGVSPEHRQITLRHLLTMTSGLQTTSFRNYGPWVASRDWVRSAIDRPMVDRPGGRMIYSTGNSHLVSAILTRSTGMSTKAFAQRHLFGPLEIRPPAWDRDPQGFYLGGNNMALSPRDLLKIGELYRSGGSLDGRQILPEAWIRESWRSYKRSRWNGYGYGYFWWYRRSGRHDVHFAWGYGGQFVFVVPKLELVVVATSRIGDRSSGRMHRREIHRLLDRYILPAVSADRPPDAALPAGA